MPTVNLATLQARVYARIDGNELLYPEPEVTALINEAVKVLNVLTGLYPITGTLTSQANRIWYALPESIIYPSRVQFENTYLERSSILQMGRSRPKWTTETTANQATSVTSWVPYGFKTIAIHPADSLGGHTLTVTGLGEPPLLVNPTDTVAFSNDVFAAFDEYCSSVITLKESPKTFAQASASYQAFLRIIKKVVIYRSWVAPRYFISEVSQDIKR